MFERYYIDYSENALDYCMLSDYLSNRKNVDKIRAFHNALMVGGTCNLIKYWTKESFETPIEDLVELICTFRP
ncbi:MAG: hypothetical protein IJF29_04915 [Firmicutes bacterium]|nr:hypothetical protein [Bacillota bacterium]